MSSPLASTESYVELCNNPTLADLGSSCARAGQRRGPAATVSAATGRSRKLAAEHSVGAEFPLNLATGV
jgi:hypothetical protein